MRAAIVLLAVLIGAAAPARAWCEASCLAPASTTEHCPSHAPASTGTSITAAAIDNCPVIETARPIPARLDCDSPAPEAFSQLAQAAPEHPRSSAPQHLPSTFLKRLTPLRI